MGGEAARTHQGARGVWGLIERGVRTSVASTQPLLARVASGGQVAGTQARQANLLGPTRTKRNETSGKRETKTRRDEPEVDR
jgi:hypothetical protein